MRPGCDIPPNPYRLRSQLTCSQRQRDFVHLRLLHFAVVSSIQIMHGCQQGLIECCTPSDGYYMGTRGAIYNGVCPEALEPDFDYIKKISGQEKLMPVPSRLTRLTAVPHRHFVGSLASRPPHWQRIASLPSIFSTWPHSRSTPQAHLPGLVESVLH